MSRRAAPHLFQGFGLELEYMIVSRDGLDVLPVADQVLKHEAGRFTNEVKMGPIGWSNELALHVVEMKTLGPVETFSGLAGVFQEHVGRINAVLAPLGGCLLPTAMHPWMDPHKESHLWPHGSRRIYEAYNRIFGCQGHGWTNLQSAHLNLAFHGDQEFGRLHAALRLLLPILPALAASSPIAEGRPTGLMDTRLEYYRKNQCRIPSISGLVIPEPAYTQRDYETGILERIYEDIAPYDPDGLLQDEWLNSRGVIARFDRSAIEVRVLDVQECPAADVAVSSAIVAALKAVVSERWAAWEDQSAWPVEPLAALFLNTVRDAEAAVIRDVSYLSAFGYPSREASAAELWRHILAEAPAGEEPRDPAVEEALGVILTGGPLARRIVKALGPEPSRERLLAVYRNLGECLAQGRPFRE